MLEELSLEVAGGLAPADVESHETALSGAARSLLAKGQNELSVVAGVGTSDVALSDAERSAVGEAYL